MTAHTWTKTRARYERTHKREAVVSLLEPLCVNCGYWMLDIPACQKCGGTFFCMVEEADAAEYRASITPDPRTAAQKDADEWQAETAATREGDYPR